MFASCAARSEEAARCNHHDKDSATYSDQVFLPAWAEAEKSGHDIKLGSPSRLCSAVASCPILRTPSCGPAERQLIQSLQNWHQVCDTDACPLIIWKINPQPYMSNRDAQDQGQRKLPADISVLFICSYCSNANSSSDFVTRNQDAAHAGGIHHMEFAK